MIINTNHPQYSKIQKKTQNRKLPVVKTPIYAATWINLQADLISSADKNWAPLTGTPRQVTWAQSIRFQWMGQFNQLQINLPSHKIAAIFDSMCRITRATQWIKPYTEYASLRDYLHAQHCLDIRMFADLQQQQVDNQLLAKITISPLTAKSHQVTLEQILTNTLDSIESWLQVNHGSKHWSMESRAADNNRQTVTFSFRDSKLADDVRSRWGGF